MCYLSIKRGHLQRTRDSKCRDQQEFVADQGVCFGTYFKVEATSRCFSCQNDPRLKLNTCQTIYTIR